MKKWLMKNTFKGLLSWRLIFLRMPASVANWQEPRFQRRLRCLQPKTCECLCKWASRQVKWRLLRSLRLQCVFNAYVAFVIAYVASLIAITCDFRHSQKGSQTIALAFAGIRNSSNLVVLVANTVALNKCHSGICYPCDRCDSLATLLLLTYYLYFSNATAMRLQCESFTTLTNAMRFHSYWGYN